MSEEFRSIIRVAGTNLEGTEKVAFALTGIRGIGTRLAIMIVKAAGFDPETRLGSLSDVKIKQIEEVLENLPKYNLPSWLLNRQKDVESGNNNHLIGPNLILRTKTDVDQMKQIRSWKGFRHTHGLKVRGQRTKTTGRNKKAVGIKKRGR